MRTAITGVPGWLGNRFLSVLTDPSSDINKKYNNSPDREIVCLVLPQQLASVPQRPFTTYVPADITKAESLKGSLDGVDTLFHLAGIIHPKRVAELYSVNAEGTKNVIKEAVRAGVRRIIFISSNSVAGFSRPDKPFTENDPYDPYLAYGRSKMLAEQALMDAAAKGQIEAVILRLCWFYGPEQPRRQTRFFKMIEKGNPIIFGSGKNFRSMSYVDNSIQAMLLAEQAAAKNQVYWIADEHPYATLDIYRTVAKILGVELKPRFLPDIASSACRLVDRVLQSLGLYIQEFHVAGEMNQNIACSIEKARRELGYQPRISLEEGMRRSIEWCRAHGQL